MIQLIRKLCKDEFSSRNFYFKSAEKNLEQRISPEMHESLKNQYIEGLGSSNEIVKVFETKRRFGKIFFKNMAI
ncbi:hypothetical protein IEE87_27125 (plasmid) [Klebsiella pneumoniae]|nr:hypothetical protein IEE87_27125 [Klebsiella pneumoniae]